MLHSICSTSGLLAALAVLAVLVVLVELRDAIKLRLNRRSSFIWLMLFSSSDRNLLLMVSVDTGSVGFWCITMPISLTLPLVVFVVLLFIFLVCDLGGIIVLADEENVVNGVNDVIAVAVESWRILVMVVVSHKDSYDVGSLR